MPALTHRTLELWLECLSPNARLKKTLAMLLVECNKLRVVFNVKFVEHLH